MVNIMKVINPPTNRYGNQIKIAVIIGVIIAMLLISNKALAQAVALGAYQDSTMENRQAQDKKLPVTKAPHQMTSKELFERNGRTDNDSNRYVPSYSVEQRKQMEAQRKAQEQYEQDRRENRPDRQYSVYAYPVYVPVPMPAEDNTLPIYIRDQYGNTLDNCPSDRYQFTQITDVQGRPLYWNEICYL